MPDGANALEGPHPRAPLVRPGFPAGPTRSLRLNSRIERIAVRAALALAMLGFAPSWLNPFDAFKAALLGVIGVGLLAVAVADGVSRGSYVVRSSGLGHAAGTLRRLPMSWARALDCAVIAWSLAALASTLASVSPRLSWFGEIAQRDGLLTSLAIAGLYAGARRAHVTAAQRQHTLAVVEACEIGRAHV